jgi:ADP-heptose:LPS heptosyltransferase
VTSLIRFSSLGDVVLAGAVASALGDVCFLTNPRYAGLVARFDGVRQVCTDASRLPEGPVYDLHNNLRSRRVRARRRVKHHRFQRWQQVALKRPRLVPSVLERYGTAAGVVPAEAPWVAIERTGGALGMAAGASVPTKVWPHFAALAKAWDGPVVSIGLPGEGVEGTQTVLESGFEATLEALGRCSVFVGGDTGLSHLAHACGIPTLVLFGPTGPLDGFWRGPSVSLQLPCQPCSRHGRPVCPIGDHACLHDLPVEAVLRSLRELTHA